MRLIGFILMLMTSNFAHAQSNEMAPAWELMTKTGERVSSTDFDGEPLVIHVWATWCPYCKKLQPGLDRLYKKYHADGLNMIALSVREDDGATPQAVLDERNLDIKTVVNGEKVAALFGVAGTPTTIFINRKGEIIAQTSSSDPDDPRLEQVFKHLVNN